MSRRIKPLFLRLAVSILISLWLASALVHADDNRWVVISMRQYQIQGASRIHLYLYAMDGTFKKALTDDRGFNDLDPVFSADGKSVRFTREAADDAHEAEEGSYIVDIASGRVCRCDPVKNWFPGISCATCDTFINESDTGWQKTATVDTSFYQSPDGKFKLQRIPATDPANPDQYEVLTQGKGSVPLAGLPGYLPADQSLPADCLQVCNGSPFITDGAGMELIFLSHHLNSTDGEQMWGLDLTTMQGAKISQNSATIYHPPSASGVFVVSEARYQPLDTTGKTVNCSYLEWWNAHLKDIRYGPDLSVCISAAIYGGQSDTNVVIPGGN